MDRMGLRLGTSALALLFVLVLGTPVRSATTGRIGDTYQVGVGISDVTGPAAGIGLMGYANPAQSAKGIHTRLFARAFIIGSGDSRVVFVSVDCGMIDQSIKFEVVKRLNAKYGDVYTPKNVLLSGTHTHSGPGGYIQYAMYGIASLGFHKGNFFTIVDGIVESIDRAHAGLQPGRLYLAKGNVEGANINRSPAAYDNNPLDERTEYGDRVDKEMTLLRIESAAGLPLGSINWFAVHPTSMNNTNRLISGDNKGYASMLHEYKMNPNQRPGRGKFVSAFASSNLGDVSPNTQGPKCQAGAHAGEECDLYSSTCGGYTQNCYALGPGTNGNMVESTEIIGRRQFEKALDLFEDHTQFVPIEGRIQYNHQYVNMTNIEVEYFNATSKQMVRGRTCPAALGYSFAGGTTDGPGAFDFNQNGTTGNIFWDTIAGLLKQPTFEQIECHSPKAILLNTGPILRPYPWTPSIVETQLLRVGNLFIAGIPGELTTMSGRRLRKAVKAKAQELLGPGEPEPIVVIAGLSNVYTHYIATFEEYQIQRYEGGSTIYGPHTLQAYLEKYSYLAENMLKEVETPVGPTPPDLMDAQISLLTPIIMDAAPVGLPFGSTKMEPYPLYMAGETVEAVFTSGHPRNNPLRGGSFFLVERRRDDFSGWDVIATDADWSTKFTWSRPTPLSFDSEVAFEWSTSPSTPLGVYRIRHFGYFKPALNDPRPYQGSSRLFEVRKTSIKREAGAKQQRKNSPLVNFWRKLTSFSLGR